MCDTSKSLPLLKKLSGLSAVNLLHRNSVEITAPFFIKKVLRENIYKWRSDHYYKDSNGQDVIIMLGYTFQKIRRYTQYDAAGKQTYN